MQRELTRQFVNPTRNNSPKKKKGNYCNIIVVFTRQRRPRAHKWQGRTTKNDLEQIGLVSHYCTISKLSYYNLLRSSTVFTTA